MSVFRFLLFPFAVLYNAGTAFRNTLYNRNYKPTTRFDLPVISVGNLAVGGTGKTPMVEYLIRLLSPEFKIATLSRGYGRKTKGFRIASNTDSAATLGDEPYQIYKKFSPQVEVTVGEERAYAIPMILQAKEDVNTIILDDAYQHRSVIPGFSILLTEYSNPFFNDYVLPMGRLREAKGGAGRTDLVVVTKCPPHLGEDEMMDFENHIHNYTTKPVFFSQIRYGEPVNFGKSGTLSKSVILVSAIANAHILEEHVSKNYILVKHFSFRDHYTFTKNDLQSIETILKQYPEGEISILTTEKDMVKLAGDALNPTVSKLPIFYLPIETEFIRNGKDFDTIVLSFVRSFKPD